jgi:hypothetical protein
VYYEKTQDNVVLLHLSLHNRLLSEPESQYYYNVPSRFPKRAQFVISNYCRLVHDRYASDGLRFSVTRSEAFHPETADLLIDEPGVGFSCATFVKGIFDAVRLPLVDSKTWPLADEKDKEWFSWLLGVLKAIYIYRVDQEHFARIDVSCKWSRYRPEQIAFAACIAPPKATYKQVKIEAELLMKKVSDTFPPLSDRPPVYHGPPAPPLA